MSIRSRRHAEEYDNPAWPGLVDLFAFGMLIVLLLWAEAASQRVDPGPPGSPEKQIERRLLEIAEALKPRIGSRVERVSYVQNPQRVEIRTHIRFPTQKYVLSPDQQGDVSSVIRELIQFVRDNVDTLLVISGKADPRPFGSEDPPRDNIELSALRAAEVSRLLFDAGKLTPDLQQRISVRGLGDQGMPVEGNVDDERYEQYRTVTFELHVDKLKLAQFRDAMSVLTVVP